MERQAYEQTPAPRRNLRSAEDSEEFLMLTPAGATPIMESNIGGAFFEPLTPITSPAPRVFLNMVGTECFGTIYTECKKGWHHSQSCRNW